MWMLTAIVIALMTLIGVVSVLVTRGTKAAFVTGFNTMALVTGIYAWHGEWSARAVLVVAMVFVYLARINWTLLGWSRQTAISKLDHRITGVERALLPVILTNTVGWVYCLPFYFALRNPAPPGAGAALALALYVLGTVFHFGADYQKRRFKLRESNSGKLLDTGFWALCRHPNYFGDFVIYISFAVAGASVWGWIAPFANLLQYIFDAIPKNEKWAAQRYGREWDAYRARTKVFVPYLV
jgi:steroid 5-alpha reductase family enzyme